MRTVNVAGANLYQLALQYLGSAEQWNRIAQANGLIDPMVPYAATLLIPSADVNAGGGVFVPAT